MMDKMAVWESRKIDYVIDFFHAPIDNDVYPHLPAGFNVYSEDENETYFLKLKKKIYGTRQAAENWFVMFKTGLEYEGSNKTR